MGGEAGGIAKPFFETAEKTPKPWRGVIWGGEFFEAIKIIQELREKNLFGPAPHFLAFNASRSSRPVLPGGRASFLLHYWGLSPHPKKKALKFFFLAPTPKKKNLVVYLHFVHRTGLGLPQMVLVLSISASSPRAPKTSNCSLLSRRCRFFAHLVRPLARIIPP